MPRKSPYIIMLSSAEARELRRRAAHYTACKDDSPRCRRPVQ